YFLAHGGTYYVMAGRNQFNLIGDQRLVSSQDIQLGTLENETRGGIARVKFANVDPAAIGASLSATQILDSTFLTFGGVSALEASDVAAASAGFIQEAVNAPTPTKLQKKLGDISDTAGSSAFDLITKK